MSYIYIYICNAELKIAAIELLFKHSPTGGIRGTMWLGAPTFTLDFTHIRCITGAFTPCVVSIIRGEIALS